MDWCATSAAANRLRTSVNNYYTITLYVTLIEIRVLLLLLLLHNTAALFTHHRRHHTKY